MSEEQYLTNELYLEELVRHKDARIKWLETEVLRYVGEAVMADDRIAALEAALREIEHLPTQYDAASDIARAALAPEKDK